MEAQYIKGPSRGSPLRFGSLAYHLASRYDVQIKACTLSQAQMDWAKDLKGETMGAALAN